MDSDTTATQNDGVVAYLTVTCESDAVTREERKQQTLRVLVRTGAVMPTVVVFRNVKLAGATFGESSVRRFLNELLSEGLVRKVDPKSLDTGDLVDVGKSDDGYWLASQAGRDRIKSDG